MGCMGVGGKELPGWGGPAPAGAAKEVSPIPATRAGIGLGLRGAAAFGDGPTEAEVGVADPAKTIEVCGASAESKGTVKAAEDLATDIAGWVRSALEGPNATGPAVDPPAVNVITAATATAAAH